MFLLNLSKTILFSILFASSVHAQLLSELFNEKSHLIKLNISADEKVNLEGKILYALGCEIDAKDRDFALGSKKKNTIPQISCIKDPKEIYILLLTKSGKKIVENTDDYKKSIYACPLEREIDMSKINTYKYAINFTDCKEAKPYL